ncbi:hypothetical protein ACH5RR_015703 [Cinchona calisaya]|uniref:Uncharacterized protein n=1 Tax=Cinchona calisaya TaxID=153742 RepID=A0ABD2ZTY3_9GENT
MHIEKNVFDNIFHTVMDNKDRTKGNAKARTNISVYCTRSELELKTLNNEKLAKPKANFSFSLDQQREICNWVEGLKILDGMLIGMEASYLGCKVMTVMCLWNDCFRLHLVDCLNQYRSLLLT